MTPEDKKLCERLSAFKENISNDMIAVYETPEECIEAAQAIERLSAEKAEILCIVHRDGGRYIAQHGIEKAFTDALTTIYKWRDAFDELATIREYNVQLECALNNLRAQLAEPEPVAFIFNTNDECLLPREVDQETFNASPELYTPLYLHP